ncbi:histone acetyltransferase KAT2A-like [Liolophura sinensis]|uniref:histone acetyltransferase KAT2A-like n=1 Tax=Liolophura sinensis TaxID=3198878 RepID=UPI0031598AB4
MSRPNNLQRIAQKKTQVRKYPRNKKLEKLAVYSSCKSDGCKCNGWKNPNPPPNPPQVDLSQPLASLTDPCRSCGHTLGAHVSHLENEAEEELNWLLKIVVDVENLFMCVHKEEDPETKQVYFCLFKLLRKCILNMSKPTIEGQLGSPPFEKPSIAKGVTNFVLYKFGHLAEKEWRTMYDLAKMFLHCLNHWKLETPTSRKQNAQTDDFTAYQLNYTRWLCYCHVPAFCDSLQRYETTLIFGRTLLRSVFQTMRRQLLDKFRAEKEKMPPEKRTLVLNHFPRFLSMLEEEVYGANSPIWDPDYSQNPANIPITSPPTTPPAPTGASGFNKFISASLGTNSSPSDTVTINVSPGLIGNHRQSKSQDTGTLENVMFVRGKAMKKALKSDIFETYELGASNKRFREETQTAEDSKRKKVEGDVSAELVSETVATISDPDKMVGPDVSFL